MPQTGAIPSGENFFQVVEGRGPTSDVASERVPCGAADRPDAVGAWNLKKFSPEAMAPVCGIDAKTIRRSRAPLRDVEGLDHPCGAWAISQHVHGTTTALPHRAAPRRADRQRRARVCTLCAARTTCRGAPTAHPDVLSDIQRVATPEAKRASKNCGAIELDGNPASPCRDHARREKRNPRHVHHGETRRWSDPDVDHAREALASLDHMVVQDIFSPKLLISPTW